MPTTIKRRSLSKSNPKFHMVSTVRIKNKILFNAIKTIFSFRKFKYTEISFHYIFNGSILSSMTAVSHTLIIKHMIG